MNAPDRHPGPSASPLDEPGRTRANPADRWAHRRGEPRVFALFWTMYLMGAALVTVLMDHMPRGLDAAHARTPSRVLLVLIAVGVALLWPMTRLSQGAPRRPFVAALVDVFVILLPMQAVLWPATFIAMWSWTVTGALAAVLACWTALFGGIVAVGTRSDHPETRTLWTCLCAAIVVGGPVVWALAERAGFSGANVWLLFSPASAVYVMTGASGGHDAAIDRTEWAVPLGALALAVPMWVWAALPRSRGDAPVRGVGYT